MAPNALVDLFCRNQKKYGTERVNMYVTLYRTEGHGSMGSMNDHSDAVISVGSTTAALSAGHSGTEQRAEHSSVRGQYNKLATERAPTVDDASLLRA